MHIEGFGERGGFGQHPALIFVDVDGGEVVVDGERFETAPLPPFMQDMLSSGGLVPWGRERLDGERE